MGRNFSPNRPDPADWLFKSANPSIRYFALRDLAEVDENSPEMLELRQEISRSPAAIQIFEGQEEEGYWFHPDQYRNETKFYGTAWRFILLAELGVDGRDPRVRKTAEFLFHRALDEQTGGFTSHDPRLGEKSKTFIPCFNGSMLWSYIRFGYLEDPRIQNNLKWVVEHARFDDGEVVPPLPDWMLKDGKFNGGDGCYGRHSCIRAVGTILQALSEIPPQQRSPAVQEVLARGIEFILKHHVYKKSHDLNKTMNSWITQLANTSFDLDMLGLLYILTREGCHDERMAEAIGLLERKQGKDGKWRCRRSLVKTKKQKMPISLDEVGQPGEWVSLRALTVLQRYSKIA